MNPVIAIQALIEAAEYAAEVLDNYSDVEDDDNCQHSANKAMIALDDLNKALTPFRGPLRKIDTAAYKARVTKMMDGLNTDGEPIEGR